MEAWVQGKKKTKITLALYFSIREIVRVSKYQIDRLGCHSKKSLVTVENMHQHFYDYYCCSCSDINSSSDLSLPHPFQPPLLELGVLEVSKHECKHLGGCSC